MTAPGSLGSPGSPDTPGSPGTGGGARPTPPPVPAARRPTVVDVTDGRLAALRRATSAGAPARWIPPRIPGQSGPPGQPGRPTVVADRVTGDGEEADTLEVGELGGPGPAALTITGLEPRPTGPVGRARPFLTQLLPMAAIDAAALAVGWAAGLSPTATGWLGELGGPGELGGLGGWGALGEPGAATVLMAAAPLWWGLVHAAGGYPGRPGGAPPLRAVLDAGVRFAAVTSLVGLLLAPGAARRLVVSVPVTVVLALAVRAAARMAPIVRPGRATRVLLVGNVGAVERARSRIAGPGVRVVGRCVIGHPTPPAGEAGRAEDDGTADDVLRRRLAATARAAGAELVLLADAADLPSPSLRRLAWTLHAGGVGVAVAAGPTGVAAGRMRVRSLAELAVLDVDAPAFTGARRAVKSAVDRCGALVLLLLLAPVMGVVAAAVKVSGPGPVIFRQERVGRHGERFVMRKFRSMCPEAPVLRDRLEHGNDHRGGVLFKMRSDPRVTRVGRILRRLSLDELPQLVNVLRGEMSLVGPRPALPEEVERYEPDVLRRLLVKPGLTGMWQVSGRADLDWIETVRLDLGYVENWSLSLDALILLRTVRAVLGGAGAR